MAKITPKSNKRLIINNLSSEDETPIAKRPKSQQQVKPSSSDSDLSSDDNLPIAASKHSRPPLGSLDGHSTATTTLTTTDQPSKLSNQPSSASILNSGPDSDSDSDDDDDQPLFAKPAPCPSLKRPKKPITPKQPDSDSESDHKPLIATLPPIKKHRSSSAADVKPDIKPDLKPKTKPAPSKRRASKAKTEDPDEKKTSKRVKTGDQEGKPAGSEEEEDEQYKWWEETKDDDTKKWTTLEHHGVLFPPPYVPLPKHVKMKYRGKPVDLPPESEEVAGFFGSMLNSDHVKKETFCQNFFKDFLDVLRVHPPRDGTKITEFAKCDFEPIFQYYDAERERKKSLSKEEKKKLKDEKDALELKYKSCTLDGRLEKVGNFRVEPPSLFRGRGEHPKTGMVKRRIFAEDITINCGADSKFPDPPPGHKWGEIVHLDKASWLAMWKENINGAFKYVFLAPSSSLKGQSDMKKFEKARLLKDHIERIRADYRAQLVDKVMATRQRATAMYLIDRFALRAGNEKGDDEADTVGCCSLRCEHLTLEPPFTVKFDFLGKDSIRFRSEVQVDELVFKNLKIFKKPPKEEGDMIFDRITTASLNKHLGDYMPGLSAKVFRTYNASYTFEKELDKNMRVLSDPTTADKIYAYNKANRQVAILCNHQRSVSKTHETSMEKMYEKIKAMKYQRMRLRYQILQLTDEVDKKTRKRFEADVESDMEDEWMGKHEADLELKERERITKKFEKDNMALEKEGNQPMKPRDLEDRLKEADGLASSLQQERMSRTISKASGARSKTLEQMVGMIENFDKRILAAKVNCKDRDEGKETSLGTSKLNYIDPRLTFAWCAKHEVAVEKMFTKTLRDKFSWAAATPADWKF